MGKEFCANRHAVRNISPHFLGGGGPLEVSRVFWVRLSDAQPGAKLGKSVVTDDGRVLLPSGVELTEAFLRSLEAYGIESIYLAEPAPAVAATNEVVSRQTRQDLAAEMKRAMKEVSASFTQASRGLRFASVAFRAEGLKRTVDRVVSEVLANPRALVTLQDIRQVDEYTMLHSIEVCILSAMVGNALGLSRAELGDLALSALLHDIGKTGIPPEVLNKPARLTPEETAIMNRHTSMGWSLLRTQKEVCEEAALVALQHHERWAGPGGYPMGLAGEKIHPYARICAVADVYDAMTADRVYRRGLAPAEALEVMTGPMKDAFQPDVLKAFLGCVAPFPLGLLVELSDGRMGEVVGVNPEKLDRPVIRVMVGVAGVPLTEPYEIKLSEEPSVQIVRHLPDVESAWLEEVQD